MMHNARAPGAQQQADLTGGSNNPTPADPTPTRVEVCATTHGPCVSVETSSNKSKLAFLGGVVVGVVAAIAVIRRR
jgi:hypothetical protein